MADKTYSELLRDPRWQRKRLEVLSGDGFECRQCGAKDKTLHVNHRWYKSRKKPWEYDTETLETLCEDCHDLVSKAQDRIKEALLRTPSSRFIQIAAYIEAGIASSEVTGLPVPDYGSAQGVADHLHVTADMVIEKAIRAKKLTARDVMDLELLGAEIERMLDGRERPGAAKDAGTDEVDC